MSYVENFHSGIDSDDDLTQSLAKLRPTSPNSCKAAYRSPIHEKSSVDSSDYSPSLNIGFNEARTSATFTTQYKSRNTSRQYDDTLTDSLMSRSSSVSNEHSEIRHRNRSSASAKNLKQIRSQPHDRRIYLNKYFLNHLASLEKILWTYQEIDNNVNISKNSGVLKILD